jgi:hypothetical protein
VRDPSYLTGLRLVADPTMLDRVQHSRSPSRAKRRAKLGHPQHTRLVPSGQVRIGAGMLVAHSKTLAELRAEVERRVKPHA